MSELYCCIVSMQGSEAIDVIDMYPEDKLTYLKMWDHGEYHDVRTVKPYPSRDVETVDEVEPGMRYVVSQNPHHEFVALTLVLNDNHPLFEAINDKGQFFKEKSTKPQH